LSQKWGQLQIPAHGFVNGLPAGAGFAHEALVGFAIQVIEFALHLEVVPQAVAVRGRNESKCLWEHPFAVAEGDVRQGCGRFCSF
jgi:hypothetical protein